MSVETRSSLWTATALLFFRLACSGLLTSSSDPVMDLDEFGYKRERGSSRCPSPHSRRGSRGNKDKVVSFGPSLAAALLLLVLSRVAAPPRCQSRRAMSRTEAAIRRAGAAVALAVASALIGFLAVQARADLVLALHAVLLLGCAAVLLSPAHGAVPVDNVMRRATAQAARRTALDASPLARAPAGLLRWLGFVGIALFVTGDVPAPARMVAATEPEAASLDAVKGFLLLLMFSAAVWALYVSMVRGRGGPPPVAAAAATAEADRVKVYILFFMFLAGVLALDRFVVALDTGRGGLPPAAAAAEEDLEDGKVSAMAPRFPRVVVD